MRIRIVISICVVFLSGCIELYNLDGVEEISDLLVIEGTITDNESVFVLRRSVGLYEKLAGDETVNNAIVYVEKDNGEQLHGVFQSNGKYVVQTGELDADVKYRLYVKSGGEEYRSEFLSPLFTSEIGSITHSKEGNGEPVNIYIYTNDPDDKSRYYKWSYNEIWEVKAELFANYGYIDDEPEPKYLFLDGIGRNKYYCWVRDYSKTILLESAEDLSENIIHQKKLIEIPSNSEKLSILYNISVKQNQIRKEAYDYYTNLQKNIELSGSIFAPIPSEIEGNIRCLSNPNIPVVGYVEVSTTTMKELFFSDDTVSYYEPKYPLGTKMCVEGTQASSQRLSEYEYTYLFVEPGVSTLYAPVLCVDCRLKKGATRDRPDYWPNGHYSDFLPGNKEIPDIH